jgi:hypothetical protein
VYSGARSQNSTHSIPLCLLILGVRSSSILSRFYFSHNVLYLRFCLVMSFERTSYHLFTLTWQRTRNIPRPELQPLMTCYEISGLIAASVKLTSEILAPCNLVEIDRPLIGAYCLHHRGGEGAVIFIMTYCCLLTLLFSLSVSHSLP